MKVQIISLLLIINQASFAADIVIPPIEVPEVTLEDLDLSPPNSDEGRIVCYRPNISNWPKDKSGSLLEGFVLYSASIDNHGRAKNIVILKSSNILFEQIAIDNLEHMVFKDKIGQNVEQKYVFTTEK